MALKYHRCGLWSRDALHVAFNLPWEMNAMSRITRLQARACEGLGGSLSNNGPASGSNAQALLSDRCKGSPRNFVAAPNYSTLLRSTRRRHHELGMKTRDRVFLSISDWVFRRMKDPLVELDPVTVNKAIIAEKKAEAAAEGSSENAKADSTVATTTSPSYFGYLPPDFPKGANKAALAAAIVLLLAALFTAAILAMRGKKKSTIVPLEASAQGGSPPGSVTNGGAREDVENDKSATLQESGDLNKTSFSGTESDKAIGRRSQSGVTSSFEDQSSSFKPIPRYSTALEQSDLPLPPSLSYSTSTKDKTPPAVDTTEHTSPPRTGEASSTQGNDLTESSIAPSKDDGDHAGGDQVRSEADGSRVMNGTSTLDTAAVELQTAAIVEMASSALHEELTKEAMRDRLDSAPTGQSSTAESSVTEPIVSLPPESELHENGPPSLPPAAEAPALEAPVAEAPALEAPVTEAPAAEAPALEAPVTEAPAAEAPALEAPAAEARALEAPVVEVPEAEATIAEAPADEGPTDEVPGAEPLAPSSAESPAAEVPAAEAPEVLSEESPEKDYDLIEDSTPAILPPVETLASLPPETEAPAEAPAAEAPAQLSEESGEQEYMLIGDSDSLVSVGELSARLARIAVLPTAADMGRVGGSASLGPLEEKSAQPEQIVALPTAADVGVPVESVAVDSPLSTEASSSQEDNLAESSTPSAVDMTDRAESSRPPAVDSTDLTESSRPPAADATKSINPPLTTEATSSQEDDFAQSSTPPALDTTEKADPPLTTEASSSQEDDLAESSMTPPKDNGNGVLHPEAITQPPSEERPSELVGVLSAAAQKGGPIGSTQFEKPDSQPGIEATADAEAIKTRRKEYAQILEKTFPAVSVGVGAAALSSLSGVDGALEVVGLLAAASLITQVILWAGPREKLLEDIRNIKNHRQLVSFLKEWKIIPEWN